ncbi:hypothetical protein HGRIS_000345 [Hohenbuehelia grisea]|uniref:Uncharacterized protein n=1 Tax=Hohenbuehelia grisea TaxID=104357 RepID=A0ABR3JQX9_9AGAR
MYLSIHLLSIDSLADSPLSARAWKMPMRNESLTRVFIVLQICGWVGFTIILWTVFLARSTIKRPHTWINFCLCWLLSCVSYLLLFLAGQQDSPHPTYELCLIQASSVYAAPPLTASATLALIIQLWFNVRSFVFKVQPRHQGLRDVVLFTFPYIPATGFFVSVLVYGIQHPTEVKPADHGMFCNIVPSLPGKASAIYVSLILAATIGIEAMLATALYRDWTLYTRSRRHSFALIIRVALFTAMGFITITVSLIYLMHTRHGAVPNIFIAILPVTAMIFFGSQTDILHAWMFWRPQPQQPEPLRIRNPAMRPLLTQSMSSLSSAESVNSDESFEPQMRSSTMDSGANTSTATMREERIPTTSKWSVGTGSEFARNPLLQPPIAARGSAQPAAGHRRERSYSDPAEYTPLRATTI